MPTSRSYETLLTRLLVGLLVSIAVQNLSVQGFDLINRLYLCWMSSALVLLFFVTWAVIQWRRVDDSARDGLLSAWRWPWPWLLIALAVAHIIIYPPAMADSLSYRLPRMFLALQGDGMGHFNTPDFRMNAMPWGWELLALPFASINALGLCRLINLTVWIVIYQMLHAWSLSASGSESRARWTALTLATAPVLIEQCASTCPDIYATGLLLAGAWMIRRFKSSPGALPVMTSLLALILASNVKPQFLVLGLPWLVWWAFAQGAPWRRVSWWLLVIAAPVYLLLSSIPLIMTNFHQTDNLMGIPDLPMVAAKAGALPMMTAGVVQFSITQLQLPVFPMAEKLTVFLSSLPGMESLHAIVPKFGPNVPLIPTIDNASFGLLHFTLICIGVALALRAGNRGERLWLAAVVFCFLASASQVVPSTIGRSFMGFIALLLPAACIGLASLRSDRLAATIFGAAFMVGLATRMLNPSGPLWPAVQVQNAARKLGKPGLADQIENYLSYQKRAYTGIGILEPVPHGKPVGILIRQVTPVANLWRPDWRSHRIDYVHEADPAEFVKGKDEWLVVAGNAKEMFPDAYQAYTNLPGWERVKQMTYLPTLRQGPETWTLYHRTTVLEKQNIMDDGKSH